MALKSVASSRSAVVQRQTARHVSVACKAQKESLNPVIAAAALAVVFGVSSVDAAKADIAGLTPCSESKAYAKREKQELKVLEKRLKKYDAGSAPSLAIKATMERTQKRFVSYAKSGVLCGTDGLPHLIADPGLAFRYGHTGEIFIPTIGFLYIAGYIGNVGRSYLQATKSMEKEYIIDVPLAIKLSLQGFAWPLTVIQELRNGTLTEKEENITVSPR